MWFQPWSLWGPTVKLTPRATSHPFDASAAHPNFMLQAMQASCLTAMNLHHFTMLCASSEISTHVSLAWTNSAWLYCTK